MAHHRAGVEIVGNGESSSPYLRELIIMTPIGGQSSSSSSDESTKHNDNSHLIRVERFRYDPNDTTNLPSDILHVAGGQHSGIIVRKQITRAEALATKEETETSVDFNVYLVDAASGNHKQENRQLRMWYVDGVSTSEMHSVAFDFFKALLTECPKDYIGFVKKIMKLMQSGFGPLRKVEIEMRIVDEPAAAVPGFETTLELRDVDVLDILERAYPNSVAPEELSSALRHSFDKVEVHLNKLQDDGKVTLKDGRWLIVDTVEKSIVKHMPKVSRSDQPTVALITSLYVEKLAVDAMIENKETYIRYKTDGESNIYTLGNIGPHKVVATKLSSIGQHSIAAGSITTRLLGGYPEIEHVLVVGVGGGVPHFTDKQMHVRLGDVVVAAPPPTSASFTTTAMSNGNHNNNNKPSSNNSNNNGTYIFCDSIKRDRESEAVIGYVTKTWSPKSDTLIQTAYQLMIEQQQQQQRGHSADEEENEKETDLSSEPTPWSKIFEDSLRRITDASSSSSSSSSSSGGVVSLNFHRPPADTDVLSLALGGGNVATVSHPDRRSRPRLHVGPIGAGAPVSLKHAQCRQDFSQLYQLKAFDGEFDSVVESICGNRVDSWTLIRGIADYGDGTKNKQWQAYASLQAASVARALVERLPPAAASIIEQKEQGHANA